LVALTLSPVMSARFVHEHGREGWLTALVNRAFDVVSSAYARVLDGAPFTLLVAPVFYTLIAAEHRRDALEGEGARDRGSQAKPEPVAGIA
jgi:multidrug efflux pump subunit AcrB